MTSQSPQPDSLQGRIDEIAEKGRKIYEEKYKNDYEEQDRGKYVVINIKDGERTVHEFSEEALKAAREKDPYGLFHMMRIGATPTLSLLR